MGSLMCYASELLYTGWHYGWCDSTDCVSHCFRSQIAGSHSNPDIFSLPTGCGLSIPPCYIPLQSAGKITLGGAYSVSPTWPPQINSSLFVVCRGDVQSDCVLLLSPINLCVQLGVLVSHQRDYSLFTTSFVVFRDLESGLPSPYLAIPHFLQLPTPFSMWTQFLCRMDWRRSWLKDISRLPAQIIVDEDVKIVQVVEAPDGCIWD